MCNEQEIRKFYEVDVHWRKSYRTTEFKTETFSLSVPTKKRPQNISLSLSLFNTHIHTNTKQKSKNAAKIRTVILCVKYKNVQLHLKITGIHN